ncbi:hypothetical protein ACFL1G_09925 [Planctomycetota bacterium]
MKTICFLTVSMGNVRQKEWSVKDELDSSVNETGPKAQKGTICTLT